MVSRTLDISTDHGYNRVMNLSTGPNSSPGLDITMSLSGNQVTHFKLYLTAFTSSDIPLLMGKEPFILSSSPHLLSFFPSSIAYHTFDHHNKVPGRHMFFPQSPGRLACESLDSTQSIMALGRNMLHDCKLNYNRNAIQRIRHGSDTLTSSTI